MRNTSRGFLFRRAGCERTHYAAATALNYLGDLINNKKQDALLSTMHPARYLIRQLRRGKTDNLA